MFAFYGNICQGNSLFFDIYGFLGLFLIGTSLNGFLCICRSCFCKRCCFVSDLYNGCCCLVLCHYGCLCCGCCCQRNRCNNCCCLSGAAFLCITGTPGLTFSTCRCSGCRCRSQTIDHLIQLSACLIQAAQNLLQKQGVCAVGVRQASPLLFVERRSSTDNLSAGIAVNSPSGSKLEVCRPARPLEP